MKISNWIEFKSPNPWITTAMYRRVGAFMEVQILLPMKHALLFNGTLNGGYDFKTDYVLPSAYRIDTSKLPPNSNGDFQTGVVQSVTKDFVAFSLTFPIIGWESRKP